MRLILILFFLYSTIFLRINGQKEDEKASGKLKINKVERKHGATCAERKISGKNSTMIFGITGSICCNQEIEEFLSKTELPEGAEPTLGDVARIIQKQLQHEFHHAYEIIISKQNFAVSSHYGGNNLCKISRNSHHLLAYQTPVSYRLNTKREAFFAAIDAQELLGSTPEGDRGHFQDYRYNHLAGEMSASIQPKPIIARARFFTSKPGQNTFLRQGPGLPENSLLPSNSHCDHPGNRRGNKCCSGAIHEILEGALSEASTSRDFDDSPMAPGVVANMIKERVQQRFGRVFEIIVSRGDFAHASHEIGDYICKIQSHGMHVMAYETPDQFKYFPFDTTAEKEFSSLSDQDPLGTNKFTLAGQRPSTEELEIETKGKRAGFPRGSHCKEGERLGSRCCNLPLFKQMYATVQEMKANDSFNIYDRRTIATRIRDAAEAEIDFATNIIVSGDDFVVSSHVDQESFCKFRVDQYYIAGWKTPLNFNKGVDQYADNGFTSFIGCTKKIQRLEGVACCNGRLRYVMNRAIDETTKHTFLWKNTDAVAQAVVNATQENFGIRFNTVVSRGDFIWLSAGRYIDDLVCKIDVFEFHALVFAIGGNFTRNEFENTSLVEIFDYDLINNPAISPIIINSPPLPNINNPSLPNIINPPSQQIINSPPQQIINSPPQQIILPPQQPPLQFQIPPQQPPLQFQTFYYSPPAYNYYVPGYGAGYCFTEDSTVLTAEGEKRMDELKLGDYVMTANATDAYFAQITSWMHREPETVTYFQEIHTESENILKLTKQHLIYKAHCNVPNLPEIGEEYFAYELKKGDCLFVKNRKNWVLERITSMKTIVQKGIYAPLTTNGRILVNNVLASCYSEVKGPILQQSFFTISSLVKKLFGWIEDVQIISPPSATLLWREIMSIVVPLEAGSLLQF